MNFLGLEGAAAAYETASAAIVSAPYEATCSWGRGTSLGPARIIEASVAAEFHDETLGIDLDTFPIATLPPLNLRELSPEAMVDRVHAASRAVAADGKILAGLGGEHTVSLGFFRAVQEFHPRVSVLQIDAHPDLREAYEERPLCHATVARRIFETGCTLVQAGVRAFSREEMEFMKEQAASPRRRLHSFSADRIRRSGRGWIDEVLAALGDEVYVTLDVDGLEASVIPHTGTPEPGGLSWWRTVDLLAAVGAARRIVGFDVVELAPEPGSKRSDFAAARLAMRLIAHALHPGRKPLPPPF